MKLINFDEQFEKYTHEWIKNQAAKAKNADALEALMPDIYDKWLNTPAIWLDGSTPGSFFEKYNDTHELIAWMAEYAKANLPIPDQLMERIVDLKDNSEKDLLPLISDKTLPEDLRMTVISMLMEMESIAPMHEYIQWISNLEGKDEGVDLAAEALVSMGDSVVLPILNVLENTTQEGKEVFLDVLCNFRGNPQITDFAIAMFENTQKNKALFSSYLGKLGDIRALASLKSAANNPEINYLDYIEIRNAVEELGGELEEERDFSGDPYYETMKRMR